MLRTNRDKLVCLSVMGMVAPPSGLPLTGSTDGVPFVCLAQGVSPHNVKIGDHGWAGDHIEPGVSTAAVWING